MTEAAAATVNDTNAELASTGPARRVEPSGTDLPRDPCPGPSASSPGAGSLGHDPKTATGPAPRSPSDTGLPQTGHLPPVFGPTLARIERLVGHPVDAEKLRAKLDAAQATVEAAPVQTLGAEAPPVPAREPRAYYLVSVGAGPVSYDHRSELKALHLRWDPTIREWTGVVLGSDIGTLEGLGLAVEVRQRRQPREPASPTRKRDHAKASVEAYGARSAQGRESPRFSLLDVTAGLPDDSREDDQRVRAQVERERQGRVRAARAVIQAHPGLETVLARDQTKLVRFCAVHHVTPDELCPHAETNGAPIRAPGTPRNGMCSYCHGWHAWVLTHPSDLCGSSDASDLEAAPAPRFSARPVDVADVEEVLATPADWLSEVRAREVACLPGSDYDDG